MTLTELRCSNRRRSSAKSSKQGRDPLQGPLRLGVINTMAPLSAARPGAHAAEARAANAAAPARKLHRAAARMAEKRRNRCRHPGPPFKESGCAAAPFMMKTCWWPFRAASLGRAASRSAPPKLEKESLVLL